MNKLDQPIVDSSFIQNLIPQKKPFVMVDKLLYFSRNKVTAGLSVSEENIFTENKVFQAPGLIEHMAQTLALHTGYQYFLKNEAPPTGYLGAIKKVEIHKLPTLGQELETTVTILHEIMGVTLVTIETICEGMIISESEMKTVLAK